MSLARIRPVLCASVVATSVAFAAREPPSRAAAGSTRFEVGLGLGVAVPVSFAGPSQVQSAFGSVFPLRGEMGLRFDDTFLGLTGEYGFATSSSCCCPADPGTCTVSTERIGLELQYHIGATRDVHAFVGLAGGLQLLQQTASGDFGTSGGAETRTYDWQGWFGEVQLGVEIPVGEVFRIDPWLQFSVGALGGSQTTSSVQGRFGGGFRLAFVFQ